MKNANTCRGGSNSVTLDNAIFWRRVAMFDLIFVSYFFTKLGSFCTHQHQKGNILNFPKHPQLLSIAHFWCPLWPFERGSPFFWTPCMLTYDLCRNLPVTPIKPKRGIPTASTITRKLSSVPFVIGVSLISDW